jgi:hypothetical protein
LIPDELGGLSSTFLPTLSMEAWKKRPLFPENVVDPNVHTSLLSIKIKNPSSTLGRRMPLQTPRYHPDYVEPSTPNVSQLL